MIQNSTSLLDISMCARYFCSAARYVIEVAKDWTGWEIEAGLEVFSPPFLASSALSSPDERSESPGLNVRLHPSIPVKIHYDHAMYWSFTWSIFLRFVHRISKLFLRIDRWALFPILKSSTRSLSGHATRWVSLYRERRHIKRFLGRADQACHVFNGFKYVSLYCVASLSDNMLARQLWAIAIPQAPYPVPRLNECGQHKL